MTETGKRVHFIGVGGVGMSGIARVASDAGMRVSGSDMKSSRYTDDLVAAGIPIFIGHDAKHVTEDIDAVVISSAIPETNPELARARELGITVWHENACGMRHARQNNDVLHACDCDRRAGLEADVRRGRHRGCLPHQCGIGRGRVLRG